MSRKAADRTALLDRIGYSFTDETLLDRALTHISALSGKSRQGSYQRLEFLGDRVLGLVASTWLYRLFPDEPEGKLSRRYNALVSRETCAEVGRAIGVAAHLRLGKQARDDGAINSGNVLGDAVEALIGALYLEAGLEAAEAFIHRAWAEFVENQGQAPKHPKSALQEWAAAHGLRTPVYSLAGRSGPHHAPRFTVSVEIPGRAFAEAEGASKQEAETAAAKALLEKLS